jgi:hypothetical protein
MKWTYFVSLSITTGIVSFPSDFGRPSIKSIVRCWKVMSDIGRGYNNPGYDMFLDLFSWQVGQDLIKCVISAFIPGQ